MCTSHREGVQNENDMILKPTVYQTINTYAISHMR